MIKWVRYAVAILLMLGFYPLTLRLGLFLAIWTAIGNFVAWTIIEWVLETGSLRVNGINIVKMHSPFFFYGWTALFAVLLFFMANVWVLNLVYPGLVRLRSG